MKFCIWSLHEDGLREDGEDLLLRDGLVGGVDGPFRTRSEHGVDVDFDEGRENRVERRDGAADLLVDPFFDGDLED